MMLMSVSTVLAQWQSSQLPVRRSEVPSLVSTEATNLATPSVQELSTKTTYRRSPGFKYRKTYLVPTL